MKYGNVIIDNREPLEYRAKLLLTCQGIPRQHPQYARMMVNIVYNIMFDQYVSQIVHSPTDFSNIEPATDKFRIVCPGPGMRDWSDEDMFTILCNRAVEATDESWGHKGGLWMVADDSAKKCDWFKHGMELRFSEDLGYAVNSCFDYMCLRDIKSEYTIEVPPNLPPDPIEKLLDGIIINGATIAGMALQIAYYLGATTIELCGIPMTGDKYYDGKRVKGHHNLHDFRLRLNQMIKIMQSKGVEIYSRNETTLDVEVRI